MNCMSESDTKHWFQCFVLFGGIGWFNSISYRVQSRRIDHVMFYLWNKSRSLALAHASVRLGLGLGCWQATPSSLVSAVRLGDSIVIWKDGVRSQIWEIWDYHWLQNLVPKENWDGIQWWQALFLPVMEMPPPHNDTAPTKNRYSISATVSVAFLWPCQPTYTNGTGTHQWTRPFSTCLGFTVNGADTSANGLDQSCWGANFAVSVWHHRFHRTWSSV